MKQSRSRLNSRGKVKNHAPKHIFHPNYEIHTPKHIPLIIRHLKQTCTKKVKIIHQNISPTYNPRPKSWNSCTLNKVSPKLVHRWNSAMPIGFQESDTLEHKRRSTPKLPFCSGDEIFPMEQYPQKFNQDCMCWEQVRLSLIPPFFSWVLAG